MQPTIRTITGIQNVNHNSYLRIPVIRASERRSSEAASQLLQLIFIVSSQARANPVHVKYLDYVSFIFLGVSSYSDQATVHKNVIRKYKNRLPGT